MYNDLTQQMNDLHSMTVVAVELSSRDNNFAAAVVVVVETNNQPTMG